MEKRYLLSVYKNIEKEWKPLSSYLLCNPTNWLAKVLYASINHLSQGSLSFCAPFHLTFNWPFCISTLDIWWETIIKFTAIFSEAISLIMTHHRVVFKVTYLFGLCVMIFLWLKLLTQPSQLRVSSFCQISTNSYMAFLVAGDRYCYCTIHWNLNMFKGIYIHIDFEETYVI